MYIWAVGDIRAFNLWDEARNPRVIHEASALPQLSPQEHNVGIISPDCIIIFEQDDKLITGSFEKQALRTKQAALF